MVVGRIFKITFQFLIAVCMCFAANLSSAQLQVSTVAGGFQGNGGPATAAALMGPGAVAVDNKDRLYIGENFNCGVRRVNANGVLTSFAGTQTCGFSGDGGPAGAAFFSEITAMTFDHNKNLIVADSSNFRIRKIDSNQIVTTIAGNGIDGDTGDGMAATKAEIDFVQSIAVDAQNRIYFSDRSSFVRMVDTAGVIHTIGGDGTTGFSGDGGPATSAEFSNPLGVAVDASGNLYIADSGNFRVRKVDSHGVITTFAGNGTPDNSGNGGPAISAGLDNPNGLLVHGNTLYITTFTNFIWAVDLSTQQINLVAGGTVSFNGFNGDGNTALATEFAEPVGMAFDSAGNMYVADEMNDRIREINTEQIVSTVAGGYLGDGGKAKDASLNEGFDSHIAFDAMGNLYIAEPGNNRVRKVDAGGIITTFAGNGLSGYSGDGGLATEATFRSPNSVAVDSQGNVYIADNINGVIRKVDTTGIITTFAQPTPFGFLSSITVGLAFDASGNLYSTDGFSAVYKIDPSGSVTIFAGQPFDLGFTAMDGIPATQSALEFPAGLAFDASGNLYIAEWLGNRIRKVDTNGIISTVAGTGVQSFSGDGGPATNAALALPFDVQVDRQGNIYIADFNNARIRVIDATGTIQTVAGNGIIGFNGNHLPAAEANIMPMGLAIKPNGNVFFTDEDESLVRKLHKDKDDE